MTWSSGDKFVGHCGSLLTLVHFVGLTLALGDLPLGARAMALDLSLPVSCEIGRACFVQQYMDVGGEGDPRDHRCGRATYKGHSGVDIRVPSAAAAVRSPVPVIAAADGTVLRTRDGVSDAFVRDVGPEAMMATGCGNAVVIGHGAGWETLYCHMRKGTVAVKPGDRVARGQKLGEIGWSGLADMAHVHFQVMRQGKVFDPFTGKPPDGTCAVSGGGGASLWTAEAAAALAYKPGEILGVGFSPQEVTNTALETEDRLPPVTVQSANVLFYARVINVQVGDVIALEMRSPDGQVIASAGSRVERPQALAVASIGRATDEVPIMRGRWTGRAVLLRASQVVSRAHIATDIQ